MTKASFCHHRANVKFIFTIRTSLTRPMNTQKNARKKPNIKNKNSRKVHGSWHLSANKCPFIVHHVCMMMHANFLKIKELSINVSRHLYGQCVPTPPLLLRVKVIPMIYVYSIISEQAESFLLFIKIEIGFCGRLET